MAMSSFPLLTYSAPVQKPSVSLIAKFVKTVLTAKGRHEKQTFMLFVA